MPRPKKIVIEEKEVEGTEVEETVFEEKEAEVVKSVALPSTGKFEAVDGFVYSPEGKLVSKKMDVIKAEDVARKFNYKMK
jgi:hypothetical protein